MLVMLKNSNSELKHTTLHIGSNTSNYELFFLSFESGKLPRFDAYLAALRV